MNFEKFKNLVNGTSKNYILEDASIEIGNSYCKVINFPTRILESIKDLLTYTNQDIYFELLKIEKLLRIAKSKGNHKWERMLYGQRSALEKKAIVCWFNDNKFPTGHLKLVEDYLALQNFKYSLVNKRIKATNFYLFKWQNPPPDLRPWQKECMEVIKKEDTGVISAPTGSGKTRVILELIKHFETNSLIILPSSALCEQILKSFKFHFGKKLVSGLKSADIKSKKKMPPIKITTYQTLHALRKKGLIDLALKDVNLIYIDESHHSATNSLVSLLPHIEHVYYKFGGSATHLRNDSKSLDLQGFLGRIIYTYSYEAALNDGFLTPVDYEIHKIRGNFVNSYHKEYQSNYCENNDLFLRFKKLIDNIPENEQILILVDLKERLGNFLNEFLELNGYSSKYLHGDLKKEEVVQAIEDYNEKKIRIMIGTQILGEGIDITSVQHLFMLQGGKSIIKILQAIGRSLRLYKDKKKSIVYDFYFENTKYLEKHAKERIRIYETYFPNSQIKYIDKF